MKQSNYYIDNEQLHAAMVVWITEVREAKATGKPIPPVTNYIGACILKIAQKLATKSSFAGYSFNDEMVSDGVENCLLYLHNYNPDLSNNAFSYFTFIIWRAFLRRIAKEKKHQYIKQKSLIKSIHDKSYFTVDSNNEGSGGEGMDDDVNMDMDISYAEEFVKSYEQKLEEERIKTKKKAESK